VYFFPFDQGSYIIAKAFAQGNRRLMQGTLRFFHTALARFSLKKGLDEIGIFLQLCHLLWKKVSPERASCMRKTGCNDKKVVI